MNVWSLDKDDSIKVLLLLLGDRIGDASLCLAPRQELDARAIRLSKSGDHAVSAYLYTYGQDDGRCGVHLEYPQFGDSDISSSLDVYENVDVDALAEMLRVHFELAA